MSSRLVLVLSIVLAGCNLFGSTPETPDSGEPPDTSAPADMADGGEEVPDMFAGDMNVADMRTPDMPRDLDMDMPSDGGGDMGNACTTNATCPTDLACIDGVCAARLALGETCTDSDDCDGGLCSSAGVCAQLVTPLARYRVDEAGAGIAPIALEDDAADPLDLSLSFEPGSGFHEDHDGNRYARFVGLQTGGAAPIAGTKIEDAFDGGTTGTLEVKSMTFLCEDNQHRVLGMGTGGSAMDGWFTLREIGGNDQLYLKFLANMRATQLLPISNGCLTAAPVVTHVVVDTSALSANDRIRMYVDGRRTPLLRDSNGAALPTLNQALDIGLPAASRYLYVGRPNPISGSRTTDQRVWYAALYSEALSNALIQRNASQILRNDDAPGGAGIVTRTIGTGGDFISLQSWFVTRGGDLTRRRVVHVVSPAGVFMSGEQVTSPDGCSGTVVAEDRNGTRSGFLTLDDYASGCVEGAVLTGATSGASGQFGGVLLRGTIERAAVLDPTATGAQLTGSTTDADHYFVVTSASDMHHRGQLGTGAAIQPNADGLLIGVPFTRVERIRVANTPVGSAGLRVEAPDVTIRNVLIEASGSDAVQLAADRGTVEDSIIFNTGLHGIVHQSGDGVVLRNLTIVGATDSAVESIGGAVAQNIIANGSPSFLADAAWAEAAGNLSTDGTAPGTGAQTNVSIESLFVSLTPAAEDLHLGAGSPAVDAGVDTGEVSWDVDLHHRIGLWDIGADER